VPLTNLFSDCPAAARLMGYAPNDAEQETAFGKKGL
jgi:hypothetical protein